LSSEAIIYWHAKGKQPQGRQQFLKNTEGLIKVGSFQIRPLPAFAICLTVY
jgi:hypothetical protein